MSEAETAPRQKFDEVHEMCIRLLELSEKIMEHPLFPQLARHVETGELIGSLASLSNEAARFRILLNYISQSNPLVYEMWLSAAGWQR